MLITGATGFLARHVLLALRARHPEQRVIALVREPAAWRELWLDESPPEVEMLVGSLDAPAAWLGAPQLRELGAILHLGARVAHTRSDAQALLHTNVSGTRALMQLAGTARCRIVFASTAGTVGCFRTPDASAVEGDPFCERTVRRWPYYASKVAAEREAAATAAARGIELVVLRPPVLLGPGDHRFRSSGHVLRVVQQRLPFLVRGGFHFVDVRDVAAAAVRALGHPTPRAAYHLPGTASTIEEFCARVAALAGVPPPGAVLPFPLAWLAASASTQLADWLHSERLRVLPDPVVVEMARHYWGLASHHAGPDLGFQPRPADETLRDTIAWLRAHHPALRA